MAEIAVVETPAVVNPIAEGNQDMGQMFMSFIDAADKEEAETFLDLMAGLKSIWMAAKDLHYHAKGEPFYGLHLLADMVADSEKFFDEIAEIYYLGERGEPPPDMREIFSRAVSENLNAKLAIEDAQKFGTENDIYLKRLIAACGFVIGGVEKAKSITGNLAGTQAVLDEISKTILKDLGLLKRSVD